jgi:hypothetical protein
MRGDGAEGVAFFLNAVGGVASATGFGDGASVLGGGTMGVLAVAVVPAIRVDVLYILCIGLAYNLSTKMESKWNGITSIGGHCRSVLWHKKRSRQQTVR